jgi:hypothetical protein
VSSPTITEADWLLAVQANRRDLAAAVLRGDTANQERLRADYERLQAWKPGGAQ